MIKRTILTLFVMFLYSSIAKCDNEQVPEYWTKWVDIQSAENFIFSVQSGSIVDYYEKIDSVQDRVHDIIKSIDKNNRHTKVVAMWVLADQFKHVDPNISIELYDQLKDFLKPDGVNNLTICNHLCEYYHSSKDIKALIEFSILIKYMSKKDPNFDTMKELLMITQPEMEANGLSIYIPKL